MNAKHSLKNTTVDTKASRPRRAKLSAAVGSRRLTNSEIVALRKDFLEGEEEMKKCLKHDEAFGPL